MNKDTLWNIVEGSVACMVTTNDDGVMRSRPMAPYISRDEGLIRFITDRDSHKVEELHHDRDVALSFVDNDRLQYVSVSGRGEVTADRQLIKSMWGPYCDTWFSGDPETVDVVVITVKPEQAEIWDNNVGKLVLAYELTKGYFTDDAPNLGENAKLEWSQG